MGHNKSFSEVDDDFQFDEAYFRTLYKPLSSLPTPPASSRNSSASDSPCALPEDEELLNPELRAPAVYLTQMVPPALSVDPPCLALVQTMLSYARLPMDTIALAGCILDALPTRFHRSWRMSYPRSHTSSKRHTVHGSISSLSTADVIYPEVVILASLVIAVKFVDDTQASTQFFSSTWGRDIWSCEQLNHTEQCIMETLDYRILPLWDSRLIKQARHDIELMRRELVEEDNDSSEEARQYELYDERPISSGEAVVGLGLQMTPAETPKSEVAQSPHEAQEPGQGAQEALNNLRALPDDYLHMPSR